VPGTTGWGSLFDGWPTTNAVTSGIGSVTDIHGTVTVTHTNGITTKLHLGDPIMEGDVVETAANSHAQIRFVDNTELAVGEKAKLEIDEYVFDFHPDTDKSNFSMLRGLFYYTSGLIGHADPDDEHVKTPYGSIGIRGTEFIVQPGRCSSTDTVYLIQGELAITPRDTPGVTNICDAPVTISITPNSVMTNALDQATFNSISNQVFQDSGVVTFPSWLEQYFSCTNDPAAASNADPDGDGQDNYMEFLAGTNPTSSASSFHLLSTALQGNNLMVSWMCGGGRTNVLQAATALGGSWFNVSPNIVLSGSGDSVTNYLDIGAVTNSPARFYRVQLVQ